MRGREIREREGREASHHFFSQVIVSTGTETYPGGSNRNKRNLSRLEPLIGTNEGL